MGAPAVEPPNKSTWRSSALAGTWVTAQKYLGHAWVTAIKIPWPKYQTSPR